MKPTHGGIDARGFTVVELMISMAIMLGITAAIFALTNPAHGTYRTQPEVSDMQQRLRVGTSFISNDLLMAGAGSPAGGVITGSLMNYFAPVQPVRLGMLAPDPAAGVFFRDDAITIYYIPVGSPQTSLAVTMPQPSAELKLDKVAGCAGTDVDISCDPGGFKKGMRVIVFDETGAFDDLTVTQVQEDADSSGGAAAGHLQHNRSIAGNVLSKRYEAGAQVAQIMQRTFYWNQPTLQLMSYDGDQRDEAVADNVVGVQFEYFGDPRSPVYVQNPDGSSWTTYGPKPPLLGNTNGTTWPASENCTFRLDPASGRQVGRLPDLAPGSPGLVPMGKAMLTDGPWCPDATFPARFDADLMRIRKVGVRLRVQVASAALRGPAGLLYARGGTASMGRNLVPDQEIRFEITPRNFNLGR